MEFFIQNFFRHQLQLDKQNKQQLTADKWFVPDWDFFVRGCGLEILKERGHL